jgi:hypothetical protein
MNEEPENPLGRQLAEPVAEECSEMMAQGTNAFDLGRRVLLTSLGMAVLGSDELQTLFQRSVERGEQVQHDAQKTISGLGRQAADGTTSAISSRVAALLNKLPGVSITYKVPAEGAVVAKAETKQ